MKAMILAAGFGARLRPLTDQTPKPLLVVGGKPLLQWHIESLIRSGITEVVVNISWLAEKIEDYFGDGSKFGIKIMWSREDQPLETGGGILKALPLLGESPFVLVNADIWSDIDIADVVDSYKDSARFAHLVMVNNPPHNDRGDFSFEENQIGFGQPRLTFSGVSILSPRLFSMYPQKTLAYPLRDLLKPAILEEQVSSFLHTGDWFDIGTIGRYNALKTFINERTNGY
ncbi:MAG: nucleotidyltransferase family protein [Porticoccaceae bacterium]|nr:nucleotidyltransferase family protein [Porticoccaceae bacterium]MDG1473773.1 nucleotidyltransferase family protein [Porticoccaceae bacterium]